MSASLVYVTTPNPDEAVYIGKMLITERLAVGVNILGEVRSIYRWENEIHDKMETLLIAKTSSDRVSESIERIRSLHTYQCPCVIAWRLDTGNKAYLDWIEYETTQ